MIPSTTLTQLMKLRAATDHAAENLVDLVEAHRARAHKAAASDPFVDLHRANQVADACIALLNATSTSSPEEQSWVAAACAYFASVDDDEDDFSSVIGFDDDAEVINYVANRLGLPVHIELS